MKEDRISIIIPVYNVQKYLKRCLDSVLGQLYSKIEVLLIDDGSTDGSGEICDAVAEQDERVRVWHTENRGPSAARNFGIEQSQGSCLLFVDSDDILSADLVSFLYRKMQENAADIAACNYIVTTNGCFLEREETRTYTWTTEEALKNLLYQKYYTTGPVCKLFRKELFSGIRFPVGRLYEDTLAVPMLVGAAKRVVCSDAIKYGYYRRTGSTMQSAYREETYQYVEMAAELMAYIEKEYPQLKPAALSRFVWANMYVWIKMPLEMNNDKKKNVEKNLKQYRLQVLRDPQTRLQNKQVILLSFLGQRVLQKIYAWNGKK